MTRVLITHAPAPGAHEGEASPGYDMSILSTVRDVEGALHERGYKTRRASVTRDLGALQAVIRRYRPAVIFNLCERINNDPRLEKNAIAVYEIFGKRYTGNTELAAGLCLRKSLAKQLLRSVRIATPDFLVAELGDDDVRFDLPAIVKPLHEDGSAGITMRSVVKSQRALRNRVRYVHQRWKQPALVERFVSGREIQVALLGNRDPHILAVAQLSYRGLPRKLPQICSYSAKWDPKSAYFAHTNPVIPAPIPEALRTRIEKIALAVHELFDLRGYARIDFRVRGNKPYVIDINPNPDISADAGLARAAAHAGYSYPDLINRIVELAQEQ
jgi:D-alanine-D-alanine ligase